MTTTTGRQLKVERVAAGVYQLDLAKAMGTSRQTLWALENAPLVSDERARAYRDGLAKCRDIARLGRTA